MKRYVVVWAALLVLVAMEVALTFARPTTSVLVAGLLVLSFLEAGLGLTYFMHLRYERRRFLWSVVGAVVLVIVLMEQFWFDAVRLLHQRLPGP